MLAKAVYKSSCVASRYLHGIFKQIVYFHKLFKIRYAKVLRLSPLRHIDGHTFHPFVNTGQSGGMRRKQLIAPCLCCRHSTHFCGAQLTYLRLSQAVWPSLLQTTQKSDRFSDLPLCLITYVTKGGKVVKVRKVCINK